MRIGAHSLSWQLLKEVLSIYFAITLLVTLTQMGIEFQHTRQAIANELSSVERTFSPALTTALWELNFEQLEALHQGIIDLPIISSMRVRDASGKTLIDDSEKSVIGGQIIHTFKLFHHFSGENIFLAEVNFQTAGDVVFDRLRVGFQMILVSALIKSTALTMLFFWAFRRRLGAPLRKLTEAVTTVDLDSLKDQHIDLQQKEANELTRLEEAFNRMLSRLDDERIAHYAALEDLNKGLEQQVAARTHDLQLANQQLEQLVRTDPLTGAANRRHFVEQIHIEIQRARREQTPLALLMMDLDHFKSINDRWGHSAGDLVLRNFADLVRQLSRTSDLLARLGGEEFALLLPNTGLDGAREVAARILGLVREQSIATDAGQTIHYSTCIGAALLGPQENHYEPLMKRADAALYRAKEAGRDRVVAEATS